MTDDVFLPTRQAVVTRAERFRASNRFGGMTGEMLTSILASAARGDTAEWMDLGEFILTTDDQIAGMFETRRMRVRQSDVKIVAGSRTPTPDDVLAASLCADAIDRIANWDAAADFLLSAIPYGHAWSEIDWGFDEGRSLYYPIDIRWVHAHRFRFDEQWQPRLYGAGEESAGGKDGYGEYLDPRFKWIHHEVPTGATYPGSYGVLRTIAWRWLFRRWADLFWIESLDRTGQPFITAKVAEGTPSIVRRELQYALDRITAEHTAVYEATGNAEIKFDTAAAALTGENFEKYMTYSIQSLSKSILGTSDGADPGANGSNAAVTTRTASTMDPKTIADTRAFWSTIRKTLFTGIIRFNRSKFAYEPVIPVARFGFEMDASASQSAEAFDSGQITSALDSVVGRVNARIMTRAQGVAAMQAFFPTIPQSLVEAMIGKGGTEDPNELMTADGRRISAPIDPSAKPVLPGA